MTVGPEGMQAYTEALLADFVTALRRAAAALEAEDDSTFEAAMDNSEALRSELAPCLGALAGVPSPILARRLREASDEHTRLAALAIARRDRLAEALAGLNRPDPVADAYAMSGAPRLSIRT